MDEITIEAQPRTALGKKVRALRRTGATPIHVYGRDMDPLSLQADTRDLVHTLTEVGFTTPLTVTADGDAHFVIVREIQRHPVSDLLLHVDFMAVSRTEPRQAAVPLHFEAVPPPAPAEGEGGLRRREERAVGAENEDAGRCHGSVPRGQTARASHARVVTPIFGETAEVP